MLRSAVIEVRQHLCCANVFLKFQKSLTDLESINITVEESKVQLHNSKCSAEIVVNEFFSILAGSFSNFAVDAENASFRISVKDIKLSNNDEISESESLQINLTEQDEASVVCGNCDSTLIPQQKYYKIREFPSGAIDVSEFFCHHGPNFKNILVPSEKDLFYGFQFIVVNRALIEGCTREKENHIYCKRCLKYFGETMFNNRAAKLWCDSIRFCIKGQNMEIFPIDKKSCVYKLLIKAIKETSLPSPELLLRNIHFTKVIVKAVFPNRQQQYLLLHILEKHLPMLRNHVDKAEEYKKSSLIKLKLIAAFKILYRLISKDEGTNGKEAASWPPILEYWQQDVNILKMTTSPFLFSALNKELYKNITLLPEIYRVNNDEFLLSYIFY